MDGNTKWFYLDLKLKHGVIYLPMYTLYLLLFMGYEKSDMVWNWK